MRVGMDIEPIAAATKRHGHEVDIAQGDRNFHYMEYRNADNFPLTSVGELIFKRTRLSLADHKLSNLRESSPRQRRTLMLDRIKFPLSSIAVPTPH